jgi:hypothetical protein
MPGKACKHYIHVIWIPAIHAGMRLLLKQLYNQEVPCADPAEWVTDILRHGHHVQVLASKPPRQAVKEKPVLAAEIYL